MEPSLNCFYFPYNSRFFSSFSFICTNKYRPFIRKICNFRLCNTSLAKNYVHFSFPLLLLLCFPCAYECLRAGRCVSDSRIRLYFSLNSFLLANSSYWRLCGHWHFFIKSSVHDKRSLCFQESFRPLSMACSSPLNFTSWPCSPRVRASAIVSTGNPQSQVLSSANSSYQ